MADTDKNTDINIEEDLTTETETENAADKEIAQASEETGAEETYRCNCMERHGQDSPRHR